MFMNVLYHSGNTKDSGGTNFFFFGGCIDRAKCISEGAKIKKKKEKKADFSYFFFRQGRLLGKWDGGGQSL